MDSHKMSKTQLLGMLISQRLTAAAEEIFEAVERTMAEYEEKVNKSNLEIDRQRKFLDIILNPHIKLHREDCKQHYCEERNPSLGLADSEPPQQIKGGVGTSQEELHLQRIREETDTKDSTFTVTCVVFSPDFQQQHYEQEKIPSLAQKDPVPPQRDHNLWTGQGEEKLQELEEADIFPVIVANQITPESDGEGCGEPQQHSDLKTNLVKDHQRKPIDNVLNPYVRLHREDCQQCFDKRSRRRSGLEDSEPPQQMEVELWTSQEDSHLQGIKEETDTYDSMLTVTCLQDFQQQHYEQEKGPSLAQKDPVPPQRDHNFWTGQGEEKLQELEEADIFPVIVANQITPESDGEGCGEPQSPRDFQPHSKIETEDGGSENDLKPDSNTWHSKKSQPLGKGLRSADSTKGSSDCSTLAPHEDTTVFCKVCGFPCSSDNALLQHVQTHATTGSRVCGVCGMFLESPDSLMQHIQIHRYKLHIRTHSGEKPYRCSVCGKCFRHLDAVRNHRLIHTEEKPYECSACGMSFRYIDTLKKHRFIHAERSHRCTLPP